MRALIMLGAIALSACGGEGRSASEPEKAAAVEYGRQCFAKGFTYEACRQLCEDEYQTYFDRFGETDACLSGARTALIKRGPQ